MFEHTREELERVINERYYMVPASTLDTLVHYIYERRPTGGFLQAVLSNDLKESFARADEQNRATLFNICSLLYNEAPSPCWGSPEKYKAWLAGRDK